MNDQEILLQIRAGKNRKAYRQLYRNFPTVKNMILAQGGRKQDAEDIFQEALIVLSRKLTNEGFKLTSALSTYLFAICKYLWWDLQKKLKSEAFDLKTEFAASLTDDLKQLIEEEKQFQLAENAFDKLGKKCQKLLKLFYLKKVSMKQIAKQLQFKSAKVAKNQKYKCLQKAHENYLKLLGS